MILGVKRRTNYKLAQRVVEEPKPSLLPYVALAIVAAVFAWTVLQPAISGQNSPGHKVRRSEAGSQAATGEIRTLFSADDYPVDAQRNGQEGTVQARLSIDSTGRVSGCAIIRSSGVKSLDDATCSILQRRARFRPARDLSGRAVRDSIVTPPITWRLEG